MRLLAPTPDFDIGALIGAVGHVVIRQVGKAREQPVELGGERLLLPLKRLCFVLQRRDFGDEGGGVLPPGPDAADLLRHPVARLLALLERGLNLAPAGIERNHPLCMGFYTAPGEACVERGAVLANPPSAEHDGRACNPRKSFVNTSMHEMSPEGELASRGRMRRKWPQH